MLLGRCNLYCCVLEMSLSNISKGKVCFCFEWVQPGQGLVWWWWWGVAVVERWRAVRKAHKLYRQAIQINFKAEVEEISVPTSPEVPRLGKNKYKEVDEKKRNNQSWGKGRGRRDRERKREREGERKKERTLLDSNLQIKKAKQSIMSESPHSWLLLPGSGRMKWDKTRICKLIRSIWMASGDGVGGGSGKINGHSGGRHKGPLKVYCHKH